MSLIRMKRWHTALELFLAAALIAAVVILFFVFTEDARAKGRDSARMAGLSEIAKALALYYSGSVGYPISKERLVLSGTDPVSLKLVEKKNIPAMPTDPRSPLFNYAYRSYGKSYELSFCLETESIKGYRKGCENTLVP